MSAGQGAMSGLDAVRAGRWNSVFWPRLFGYLATVFVILLETGVQRPEVWAYLAWLLSLPVSMLLLPSRRSVRWLGRVENALVPLGALALDLPGMLVGALAFSLLLAHFNVGGVRQGLEAAAILVSALMSAVALVGWPAWIGRPQAALAAGAMVAGFALLLALLANWQKRRLRRARQLIEQQAQRHAALAEQLCRYLPPAVHGAAFDQQQRQRARSQRRWLTVCFADLAGFSALAERAESEDLVALLDDFYGLVAEAALEHGGTLDKFIGDAAMVFFGEPDSRGRRADAAACLDMAIAVQQRFAQLCEAGGRRLQTRELGLRMGMHSGWCTVGSFGRATRLDYTVIGSPVNLASRLEGQAAPGQILMSAQSYELLALVRADCQPAGTLRVRGFRQPVPVYVWPTAAARTLAWHEMGLRLELAPAVGDPHRLRAILLEAASRLPPGSVDPAAGHG